MGVLSRMLFEALWNCTIRLAKTQCKKQVCGHIVKERIFYSSREDDTHAKQKKITQPTSNEKVERVFVSDVQTSIEARACPSH